eukprot:Clim_evm6s205 gene=Clim_evmTU6s205
MGKVTAILNASFQSIGDAFMPWAPTASYNRTVYQQPDPYTPPIPETESELDCRTASTTSMASTSYRPQSSRRRRLHSIEE